MTYIKTAAWPRVEVYSLLAALTAVAAFAPLLRMQIVTGMIVNACLIIALIRLGKNRAFAIALLPSLIAAFTGTLPALLIPLIPIIIAANALLVEIFGRLSGRSFLVAALAASLAKFLFLSAAGGIFMALALPSFAVSALAGVMSYNQLLTALLGCGAAYVIVGPQGNQTYAKKN